MNTFAERLEELFNTILDEDGDPYSNEAVQVYTKKAITARYVEDLRKGRMTNPSIQKVKVLANFFGVPITYFFETTEARQIKHDFRSSINNILAISDLVDDDTAEIIKESQLSILQFILDVMELPMPEAASVKTMILETMNEIRKGGHQQ